MGWAGDAFDFATDAVKWVAPAALAPLTGGASLAAYGVYGQNSANNANRRAAEAAMEFSERMSSTEVQRRKQDLLAAGLNPMLAAGSAASAPQGTTYRNENELDKIAGTAMTARMQQMQLDNMAIQNRLLEAQVGNVHADTNLKATSAMTSSQQYNVFEATARRINQEFKNLLIEHDIKTTDLERGRLTNRQLEAMQPLMEEYQRLLNMGEALGMTQKEVDQKFAEDMGTSSKWVQFIKNILR